MQLMESSNCRTSRHEHGVHRHDDTQHQCAQNRNHSAILLSNPVMQGAAAATIGNALCRQR